MNIIHSSAYKKIIDTYITKYFTDSNSGKVLDIGCGSGVSVRLFSNIKSINKVVGIDYSEDMVNLSKKINKININNGTVEILNANISALPFKNDSFDIISSFDTINFWPDHNKAILEIIRTLKTDGVFFIINAYPKEGSKWHAFVKFKSNCEYKDFLINSGLKNVESVIGKNTIIISGRK